MNFKPATPYTRGSASKRAAELHPGAFAKTAKDSAKAHRCQVLISEDDMLYLVASGPDWMSALVHFYEWVERHRAEKEG